MSVMQRLECINSLLEAGLINPRDVKTLLKGIWLDLPDIDHPDFDAKALDCLDNVAADMYDKLKFTYETIEGICL